MQNIKGSVPTLPRGGQYRRGYSQEMKTRSSSAPKTLNPKISPFSTHSSSHQTWLLQVSFQLNCTEVQIHASNYSSYSIPLEQSCYSNHQKDPTAAWSHGQTNTRCSSNRWWWYLLHRPIPLHYTLPIHLQHIPHHGLHYLPRGRNFPIW